MTSAPAAVTCMLGVSNPRCAAQTQSSCNGRASWCSDHNKQYAPVTSADRIGSVRSLHCKPAPDKLSALLLHHADCHIDWRQLRPVMPGLHRLQALGSHQHPSHYQGAQGGRLPPEDTSRGNADAALTTSSSQHHSCIGLSAMACPFMSPSCLLASDRPSMSSSSALGSEHEAADTEAFLSLYY